jgi:hypothetical protein
LFKPTFLCHHRRLSLSQSLSRFLARLLLRLLVAATPAGASKQAIIFVSMEPSSPMSNRFIDALYPLALKGPELAHRSTTSMESVFPSTHKPLLRCMVKRVFVSKRDKFIKRIARSVVKPLRIQYNRRWMMMIKGLVTKGTFGEPLIQSDQMKVIEATSGIDRPSVHDHGTIQLIPANTSWNLAQSPRFVYLFRSQIPVQ